MAEALSQNLLADCVEMVPEGGDAWRKCVPARWGVALLSGPGGEPLQLLAMKNLREAIAHRMEQAEGDERTRRVNWREVVRWIHWRRVDSEFEADWVYLEAVRLFFPESIAQWAPWTRSWFVHVDPGAEYPRYVKTTELTDAPGVWIGPLAEKKNAVRLIELVEEAFDLCRYHQILTQYPRGQACAYKEMGKCPAPCDGSISIGQYRRMVELSVAGLMETEALIEEQRERMEEAAGELRFETAARIKAHIEQLRQLHQGVLRHAGPVEKLAFVTVQAGPKAGQAKVFAVVRGRVEPVVCLMGETDGMAEVVLSRVKEGQGELAGEQQGIGLVARHLFSTKKSRGVFIPMGDMTDARLREAYRQVSRRTPAADDTPVVEQA